MIALHCPTLTVGTLLPDFPGMPALVTDDNVNPHRWSLSCGLLRIPQAR